MSLGLVDEEKVERKYSDYGNGTYPFTKYDEEKGKYYYEKYAPQSISDEEYLEIKRIVEKKNKEEVNNSEEKKLDNVNIIILVICIIGAFGLLILGTTLEGGGLFIVASIALLLISILNFFTIKVFVKISNNLHRIYKKLD